MATGHEKMRPRRRLCFDVERLEGRDMPTAATLLASPIAAIDPGSISSRTDPQEATAVPHVPTRHERAREKFSARFSGSFVTGPGRFTDQASQTFIAAGGTSVAFLH